MTKRWIGLFPCASIACVLALSCGSSDSGGGSAGHGGSGLGGNAGLGGTPGTSGSPGGGDAGADHGAGAAGAPDAAGAAGMAGAGVGAEGGSSGAGTDSAGSGGNAGAPVVITSLSPADISDLAFWMDGNATSFSDLDDNFPNLPDSGRVRNVPEALPLTGSWQAPSSAERPIREVGALTFRPVETSTGYYLKDTSGTIQTDNSTLAISLRPLFGYGNEAQGALLAPIGATAQPLGIYFVGNGMGLYFNHTQYILNKRLSRGVHLTILVRFTAAGADVQYDINGLRTSESVAATVGHETASDFILGFDWHNNADMYGYVSQVVGINRAISDDESSHLMTWLTAQPIPEAFPASKPLVAILGDSIANGDQVIGSQSWANLMLADLSDTTPDVQLLNAASNGSGVPKLKDSDYTDYVLPWYSATRQKNLLIVAAGTNDLANGTAASDLLDRYYALLDSARATGWKTVACTLLPRSNPGTISGLPAFESGRTTFNTDIVAHWASHADALANVAAISGMGAAGDSNNTTYYVDQIHPTPAGHAKLEVVYKAAVAGLL